MAIVPKHFERYSSRAQIGKKCENNGPGEGEVRTLLNVDAGSLIGAAAPVLAAAAAVFLCSRESQESHPEIKEREEERAKERMKY